MSLKSPLIFILNSAGELGLRDLSVLFEPVLLFFFFSSGTFNN